MKMSLVPIMYPFVFSNTSATVAALYPGFPGVATTISNTGEIVYIPSNGLPTANLSSIISDQGTTAYVSGISYSLVADENGNLQPTVSVTGYGGQESGNNVKIIFDYGSGETTSITIQGSATNTQPVTISKPIPAVSGNPYYSITGISWSFN
jgi:hypothetical protein